MHVKQVILLAGIIPEAKYKFPHLRLREILDAIAISSNKSAIANRIGGKI